MGSATMEKGKRKRGGRGKGKKRETKLLSFPRGGGGENCASPEKRCSRVVPAAGRCAN